MMFTTKHVMYRDPRVCFRHLLVCWHFPHLSCDSVNYPSHMEMRKTIETINDAHPTLGTALPCYMQDDHNNQLSALECRECYPFIGVSVKLS